MSPFVPEQAPSMRMSRRERRRNAVTNAITEAITSVVMPSIMRIAAFIPAIEDESFTPRQFGQALADEANTKQASATENEKMSSLIGN
jgi:hypothetical protein